MKKKITIAIVGVLSFSSLIPSQAANSTKSLNNLGSGQVVTVCREGWNNASFYRPNDTEGSPRDYSSLKFSNNGKFLNWSTANIDWLNEYYASPLLGRNLINPLTADDASLLILAGASYSYPSDEAVVAIHNVCADLNGDWTYFQS